MMPYVSIMISMFGENVHKRNPEAAKMAPAIVTALHPYLLARTLAKGPTIIYKNEAIIYFWLKYIFVYVEIFTKKINTKGGDFYTWLVSQLFSSLFWVLPTIAYTSLMTEPIQEVTPLPCLKYSRNSK